MQDDSRVPPPSPTAATEAPGAAVAWPDPARAAAFATWIEPLAAAHRLDRATLRPASSDASFRRYLRLDGASAVGAPASFIVMDAPPPQEDVRPFIAVAALLARAGVTAPAILAADPAHGFLLLSDLGDRLYLDALNDAVATGDTRQRDALMADATAALMRWQARGDASGLPPYDDALLRRELALFPEWCVQREFGVAWDAAAEAAWATVCDLLVDSALAQPTVAVHRDYMPRNLMRLAGAANPGVLDFQDAVRGPISYDLASLLRDAFISWDEEQEIDWAVRYWERARRADGDRPALPLPEDFADFWRQVEWMGLQRHLKVLGIFCRLKHRDGKPRYSEDLPRFFGYAHKVASRYRALHPLVPLLEPLMGTRRIDAFY